MRLKTVLHIPTVLVICTFSTSVCQDLRSEDSFQSHHRHRAISISPRETESCRAFELKRSTFMGCIMTNLNNWAWNLLAIKNSLANLNCNLHSELDKCLHDSDCTIQDAVYISTALTELLTYNNNSGTFLHSFLALGYACSAEGQTVLAKHAVCLHDTNEGFFMMKVVDEINDRYLRSKDTGTTEDLCAFLQEKVDAETINAKNRCPSEDADDVATLVCKTIAHAFTQIDPETFGPKKCGEFCRETEESSKTNGQSTSAAINGKHGSNKAGISTNKTVLFSLPLFCLFTLYGTYFWSNFI